MLSAKFTMVNRLKSFKYAINGIKIFFIKEHNARVHLFVAVLVILLGFLLKISRFEWVALIMVIGFVFTLEIVNTALEQICNFISPKINHNIKIIKDLAAAAVLVASIIAALVGVLIFLPHFVNYF